MNTYPADRALTCLILSANYLRQWSGELTSAQVDKVDAACNSLAEVFEEIHDK